MFDELGVQAYLGAALSLYQDQELLTAAASIFGLGARHALPPSSECWRTSPLKVAST